MWTPDDLHPFLSALVWGPLLIYASLAYAEDILPWICGLPSKSFNPPAYDPPIYWLRHEWELREWAQRWL